MTNKEQEQAQDQEQDQEQTRVWGNTERSQHKSKEVVLDDFKFENVDGYFKEQEELPSDTEIAHKIVQEMKDLGLLRVEVTSNRDIRARRREFEPLTPESTGFASLPAAAEYLGVATSYMRLLTQKGAIRVRKLGRRNLYYTEELHKLKPYIYQGQYRPTGYHFTLDLEGKSKEQILAEIEKVFNADEKVSGVRLVVATYHNVAEKLAEEYGIDIQSNYLTDMSTRDGSRGGPVRTITNKTPLDKAPAAYRELVERARRGEFTDATKDHIN